MRIGKALLAPGLALVLAAVLSCGIKTELRLPESSEPGAVSRLSGYWKGSEVVLEGELLRAGEPGREPARLVSARVYHAWFSPKETPCEGCPVSFTAYQEAGLDKAEKGRFRCRVSIEPKTGTHFFQVRLVGTGEAVGPPSNRITLSVEAR